MLRGACDSPTLKDFLISKRSIYGYMFMFVLSSFFRLFCASLLLFMVLFVCSTMLVQMRSVFLSFEIVDSQFYKTNMFEIVSCSSSL